jgi:hypothetical protein
MSATEKAKAEKKSPVKAASATMVRTTTKPLSIFCNEGLGTYRGLHVFLALFSRLLQASGRRLRGTTTSRVCYETRSVEISMNQCFS